MSLKNYQNVAQILGALGALGGAASMLNKNPSVRNWNNVGSNQQPQLTNRKRGDVVQPQRQQVVRKPRQQRRQRQQNNQPNTKQRNDQCYEAPVNICKPISMCRGTGKIRMQNRELVTPLAGSSDNYKTIQLSINPGLSQTFQWLSQIAQNYEFYKINKLVFEYVPSVGTQTTGYVAMAFDSDVLDSAPVTKQAMSTYNKFQNVSTWAPMQLEVPSYMMNKFVKNHYVRFQDIPPNADAKTYDVGQLIIAVGGQGNANAIGELYVCYDIMLEQPCANNDSQVVSSAFKFQTANQTTSLFGNLGANVTQEVGNLAYGYSSDYLILKSIGYYQVVVFYDQTSDRGTVSYTPTGGATIKTIQTQSSDNTMFFAQFLVQISNPQGVQGFRITWSLSGQPTSVSFVINEVTADVYNSFA